VGGGGGGGGRGGGGGGGGGEGGGGGRGGEGGEHAPWPEFKGSPYRKRTDIDGKNARRCVRWSGGAQKKGGNKKREKKEWGAVNS